MAPEKPPPKFDAKSETPLLVECVAAPPAESEAACADPDVGIGGLGLFE